jgi:hypothetical protein
MVPSGTLSSACEELRESRAKFLRAAVQNDINFFLYMRVTLSLKIPVWYLQEGDFLEERQYHFVLTYSDDVRQAC